MRCFRLTAFSLLLLSLCAAAQDAPDPEVVHPNQRVSVDNLPMIAAGSSSSSDIAKAAVAIVLGSTRCDPASELATAIEANATQPLARLISKINGTSCWTPAHVQKVHASFTPNGSIQANDIVASLLQRKALLLQSNGALYVLYGAVYDQHLFSSGRQDNVIREFLLLDTRYRDQRRFVALDCSSGACRNIEGIATITVGEIESASWRINDLILPFLR